MTVRWRMVAGLAGLCLALSACQQEEAPVAVTDGDETEAEGEVLQGTISDRMLPYDQIGRDTAPALPSPAARATGTAPTTGAARVPAAPAAEEDAAPVEEEAETPAPAADTEEAVAEEE